MNRSERLAAAAALLRDVTTGTTPGRWITGDTEVVASDDLVDDERWPGYPVLPSDGPMEIAECYRGQQVERRANAVYIAAMQPDVALAVAALLSALADRLHDPIDERFQPNYVAPALALADVIMPVAANS